MNGFMDYPKRTELREEPDGGLHPDADARTRIGMAHRDIVAAQRAFTDAVLELYDESPEKLDEARAYWDVPSSKVHEVLRRFRRIR